MKNLQQAVLWFLPGLLAGRAVAAGEPGFALLTETVGGMLKQARNMPSYGLTLGLKDILQSREILLLVSGAPKAAPLGRLLQPEISPQFPASFLWLHPSVTLYCDVAALPEDGHVR
jgi:6-phosphogluconolactonase/glucosamine-6-phosphate isomerase/deaminase